MSALWELIIRRGSLVDGCFHLDRAQCRYHALWHRAVDWQSPRSQVGPTGEAFVYRAAGGESPTHSPAPAPSYPHTSIPGPSQGKEVL